MRYFEAIGIPLKRGRYYSPSDTLQSEPVAIVNETFARRFLGTADPVGQRIAWGGPASHAPWMRIVGVVGDVKQGSLDTETVPQMYTAWLQVSDGGRLCDPRVAHHSSRSAQRAADGVATDSSGVHSVAVVRL